MKKDFLIRTLSDARGEKVKVTFRFFNLEDGIIHTTDKTEVQIDDEVLFHLKTNNKNINNYTNLYKYFLLSLYYFHLFIIILFNKDVKEVAELNWEPLLYSKVVGFDTLPYLDSHSRVSVEGVVNSVRILII